jgi:hypothetical protein
MFCRKRIVFDLTNSWLKKIFAITGAISHLNHPMALEYAPPHVKYETDEIKREWVKKLFDRLSKDFLASQTGTQEQLLKKIDNCWNVFGVAAHNQTMRTLKEGSEAAWSTLSTQCEYEVADQVKSDAERYLDNYGAFFCYKKVREQIITSSPDGSPLWVTDHVAETNGESRSDWLMSLQAHLSTNAVDLSEPQDDVDEDEVEDEEEEEQEDQDEGVSSSQRIATNTLSDIAQKTKQTVWEETSTGVRLAGQTALSAFGVCPELQKHGLVESGCCSLEDLPAKGRPYMQRSTVDLPLHSIIMHLNYNIQAVLGWNIQMQKLADIDATLPCCQSTDYMTLKNSDSAILTSVLVDLIGLDMESEFHSVVDTGSARETKAIPVFYSGRTKLVSSTVWSWDKERTTRTLKSLTGKKVAPVCISVVHTWRGYPVVCCLDASLI